MTIDVDTSEAVDVEAEKARAPQGSGHRGEGDCCHRRCKLGNPAFLGKAPERVVAGIRERHAAALAERERLRARLDALGGAAA